MIPHYIQCVQESVRTWRSAMCKKMLIGSHLTDSSLGKFSEWYQSGEAYTVPPEGERDRYTIPNEAGLGALGKRDTTDIHPQLQKMYRKDTERGAMVPGQFTDAREYRKEYRKRARRHRMTSSSEEEGTPPPTRAQKARKLDEAWGAQVQVSGEEDGDEEEEPYEYLGSGSDADFLDDSEVDEDADMHRMMLHRSSMLEEHAIEPPQDMDASGQGEKEVQEEHIHVTLPRESR